MRAVLSCFSRGRLFAIPWTVARQAPPLLRFSRQDYYSELPFPPPGDLPSPGMKLMDCASFTLAGRFFTTVPPGKSYLLFKAFKLYIYAVVQSLSHISFFNV